MRYFLPVVLLVGCGSDPSAESNPPDTVEADAATTPQPDATLDSPSELDNVSEPPVDATPVEAESEADMPVAPVEWTECDGSDRPAGYPPLPGALECAMIPVPLDRAAGDGATYPLRVARHKSKSHPTGEAVFFLSGGPGQGSVWDSGWVYYYLGVREKFDLVYVDQRGTGGSGYLQCSHGRPGSTTAWEACAQDQAEVPLAHMLTLDAAEDLEWVRHALGYERISLVGASYGTRLALEFLRQHEDRVTSAVLDGTAPPTFDPFGDNIRNVDRGIQRLVDDCDSDPSCLAVSPTLLDDLVARRQALAESPRSVLVGGSPQVENDSSFIDSLSAFIHESEWRFRVPRAVHEAVNGDNTLWNELLSEALGKTVTDAPEEPTGTSEPRVSVPRRLGFGQYALSRPIYAAILCTEWFPNSGGLDALVSLAAEQTWGNDLSISMYDIARACPAWDQGPFPEALLEPVTSQAKVLLMTGELDLNSHPSWAEQAVQTLPAAVHVVVPYSTHGILGRYGCTDGIIAEFLNSDGDVSGIDFGCVDAIEPPPW